MGDQAIHSEAAIFNILQATNFDDLDIDGNAGIDQVEFLSYFSGKQLRVNSELLKKVFDYIDGLGSRDGQIDRDEFKLWKENVKKGRLDVETDINDEEKSDSFYLYWNSKHEQYEIDRSARIGMRKRQIAKIHDRETDENIKWAVFVPKKRRKCKGYWHILSGES